MKRLLGLVSAACLAAALAAAPPARADITIRIDYTYDSLGFFDPVAHPERRAALETAADYVNAFADSLGAIVPSGMNSWRAYFTRPDTGDSTSIRRLQVPADTVIVYVGARDFGDGNILGAAGPGTYTAFGSSSWYDLLASRGEPGALDSPPTDFGPWGGSVAFNSNTDDPWYFGASAGGLAAGQVDFLSVACHELAHVFGFGTADSWTTCVSGTAFTGPASVASYGQNVPLDAGLGHWAQGTMSRVSGVSQEVSMDPAIAIGARKLLTDLDRAGLTDVGWEAIPQTAAWLGAASDDWAAPANWEAGHAMRSWRTAVFQASAPNLPRLAADAGVDRVDFRTAGWTLQGSGATLRVGFGGIDSAGAGVNVVEPGVAMVARSTWSVGGANTLRLDGPFDIGGNTLTRDSAGTLIVSGPQSHAPGSAFVTGNGTTVLNTDAGSAGQAHLAVTLSGATVVTFGSTQHLAALNLNRGTARLASGTGGVLVTAGLAIDPTDSLLDLTDNALIVDYTGAASPRANIAAWLAAGLNAGAGGYWNGFGIASSTAAGYPDQLTALGILDNADPDLGGRTAFAGETVDATAVLVAYTWWGDANLDGVVDANDYDVLDSHYLVDPTPSVPWSTGDFNYDGVIDANDYDLADRAFLLQSGPLTLAGGLPSPVPEPATLALAALGAAGLLGLRRRAG